MAKDGTQVLTAGPNTRLWLAPVGSVIPATVTTVFAGTWTDMGYLKDPPPIEREKSKTELEAWNALEPIRTLTETDVSSVTLNLMQTNRATFELYFGPLTYTVEGTGISIEPATVADVEKMLALELVDGTNILRVFWRRCVVDTVGAISMEKADSIDYEITMKRLEPVSGTTYKIQTNVAGLVTP